MFFFELLAHPPPLYILGPEYVLKHIKHKQQAAMEATREKILDQIYLDNYVEAAKREDEERVRAEVRWRVQG